MEQFGTALGWVQSGLIVRGDLAGGSLFCKRELVRRRTVDSWGVVGVTAVLPNLARRAASAHFQSSCRIAEFGILQKRFQPSCSVLTKPVAHSVKRPECATWFVRPLRRGHRPPALFSRGAPRRPGLGVIIESGAKVGQRVRVKVCQSLRPSPWDTFPAYGRLSLCPLRNITPKRFQPDKLLVALPIELVEVRLPALAEVRLDLNGCNVCIGVGTSRT